MTDKSVTIGVATLDVGGLRALGPAFDNGDRKAHFEAILADARRRGLFPVAGRDVTFTYASYSPLEPQQQRAACTTLVDDRKAFAILGDSQFNAGIECVSREKRTPLIASDSPPDEVYVRGAPFVFTLQMGLGRLLRNTAAWAAVNGHLKDRRIGIYSPTDTAVARLVQDNLVRELKKRGHTPVAQAESGQPLGGPQDAVAVQRFRAERVDTVFLLTSKAGFMQQAEAQGYRPRYLESDFLSGTTNTASSTYPAQQFDGALAMTGLRYGEWKAGLRPPPQAEQCLSAYERSSGRRIDPHAREAEYVALNKACDIVSVLLRGLAAAGRDLNSLAFAAALETVRDVPGGIHPPSSFSGARHDGGSSQRTLRWSADCRCWRALGAFAPLYTP